MNPRSSTIIPVVAWFVIANLALAGNTASKLAGGRGLDNTDLYQLIWSYMAGVLVLLADRFCVRITSVVSSWGVVGTLFLYLMFAESEVLAGLVAGSWTFAERGGWLKGSIIGLIGTGGWCLGVLGAARIFRYKRFEICVLGGLAGWLVEGVCYQSLYEQIPLWAFFLWLPPVIGWHYVLLLWWPTKTKWAQHFMQDGSSSALKYVAILALPCVLPAALVSLTRG